MTFRVAGLLFVSVLAAWAASPLRAEDSTSPAAPTVAPAAMNLQQAFQAANQAMLHADIPTMLELYQHHPDPIVHVLAAMTIERIRYHLDKSTEDARLCEKELIGSRPAIALYCARLANGNLRLAQGAKAAEADELDMVRRFTGHVRQSELDSMTAYVNARSDLPELRVTKPEGDYTLPLLKASYDERGAVKLAAGNGESIRITLDTGAGSLLLDQDTAERLGVRAVGMDGRTRGVFSKNVPTQYGVLDKARIGDITLENVPVEIVPSARRLIGMDVLRLLGAFRITERELIVYGKAGNRPACTDTLLTSTSVWANSLRVLTPLSINGTPRIALLDTGSSFYLNGNQAAMNEVTAMYNRRLQLRDIGNTHLARVSQATADVIISGQPIQMTFGVFRDADLPWSYILGSGALGDMDFYFDFEQQHACVLVHDNLH